MNAAKHQITNQLNIFHLNYKFVRTVVRMQIQTANPIDRVLEAVKGFKKTNLRKENSREKSVSIFLFILPRLVSLFVLFHRSFIFPSLLLL